MVKLWEIIVKEISLIRSQKVALLLIILYPLLVIGLIGSAFTGINVSELKNAKVGFVNNLSFDYNLSEKLSSLDNLSVVNYDSVAELESAIKKKTVVAGLSVSGASEYEQLKIDLYYDDSSLLSSKYFMEIAKAMIQRIAVETSQKELLRLWQKLFEISENIGLELGKTSDLLDNVHYAQETLDTLESDIDNFDFDSIDQNILGQGGQIDLFKSKMESFRSEFAGFKVDFEEMKLALSDLNSGIQENSRQLNALVPQMDSANNDLNLVVTSMLAVRESLPSEDARRALDLQIASLRNIQVKIIGWRIVVARAAMLSEEFDNSSGDLTQNLNRIDEFFIKSEEGFNEIFDALDSSTGTISDVNSKLSEFKETVLNVKEMISESKGIISEISLKINDSNQLLSTFLNELKAFRDRDPRVIAQPVIFYEKKVFASDPFGILVSNSAAVVLLLTCLLLTSVLIIIEKNQRINVRFNLTPTRKSTLLFGKIIGQLLIAFLEAAIIFAVAFAKIPLPFSIGGVKQIGFGLAAHLSLIELAAAILVIALAFISLGLIISFFTKNQSTAVLVSLLMIVPMLFLSGIILPIEFMDPSMQLISSVLPLTIANNILLGVIVKGLTLSAMLIEFLSLLAFSVIIIAIVLIKKDY